MRTRLGFFTLIFVINSVIGQKFHSVNHFDLEEIDRFANCENCMRFPCKLKTDDKCELNTMFDEFESERTHFKLQLTAFNTSSWLAIGFNAVQDMVS